MIIPSPWAVALFLHCLTLAVPGAPVTMPANQGKEQDVFCPPTNSLRQGLGAVVQDAETLRMVQRLGKLIQTTDPMSVTFLSDRRAELLQIRWAAEPEGEPRFRLEYELNLERLRAGQSEAALFGFRQLEQKLQQRGLRLLDRGRSKLRMHQALALLRMGEQENCQTNHIPESCLFPIQPPAFHKLPRGSRGAIHLLQEQLLSTPEDLESRWLLNIAHMTLGEYPAQVDPRWLIPPKAFESDYALPRFPDIAGRLGLDLDDLAGGCILDDMDNDGFLDLVVSSWRLDGQLRYFHNDGDGRFTEQTAQAGLKGLFGGLNIQQTDFNNDGWLDIWVLRGGWTGKAGRVPLSLIRNNGDGTFSDVTASAGLLNLHPTQTSVWFDYNGDGWLDVFVGNESSSSHDPDPCALFRNNRNGTFTECAAQAGLDVRGFVKGVTSADYDHDGRPDLYLSLRDGRNKLFRNEGPAALPSVFSDKWSFTLVTSQAHVEEPISSFSTWFFDYDNDGWEDLFVAGYKIRDPGDVAADYLGVPSLGERARLYRNNRDGTFVNVSKEAHLDRVLHTMGCNFGDLDNDGWLDFYLATGDPDLNTLIPNVMFRNAEGRFFQDVSAAGGFGNLQKGHAVAFGDIDNDGDQDVYVVMGGAFSGDNYRNSLFLNPGTPHHWIKLKLEGKSSNRVAIGASIMVEVSTPSGPRKIYKTVNSGGSFGSGPLRQEIGLGTATLIQRVTITWPVTGVRQSFEGLMLDAFYRLKEGDPVPEKMPLKRLQFSVQK